VGSFWSGALEATGDEALGLHLAEIAPLESFEGHGYALLSSGSLREAYRRACRYQRLIHEVTRLSLEEGEEDAVLSHARPGGRPVGRHPAEFLAVAWVRLGREVTGDRWLPRAVYFAHGAPPDASEHERIFGPVVRFGAGRTAIRVDNATLDQPAASADATLAEILDRHVHTLLSERPEAETLADRVRSALEDGLPSGDVRAVDVSRRLAMSERSLRRGLAAEGTKLTEILSRLRLERATTLLEGGRCSISEVAYLLGFSELSSFHRAFKRWTGRTPAEVRGGR
jgi:AraC-like DNA-binding protein